MRSLCLVNQKTGFCRQQEHEACFAEQEILTEGSSSTSSDQKRRSKTHVRAAVSVQWP